VKVSKDSVPCSPLLSAFFGESYFNDMNAVNLPTGADRSQMMVRGVFVIVFEDSLLCSPSVSTLDGATG